MAETKAVMVVMGGVFSDNGAFGTGPHPVPFGWICKCGDFAGFDDDLVLCLGAVFMV